MCKSRMYLLTVAVLLLVSGVAQARVGHGYSVVFSVDTVTAVEGNTEGPPQVTILASVYPNPFNPRTMIEYEVAEATTIELAVYDLRGRLVRALESGPQSIGRHQVTWDG